MSKQLLLNIPKRFQIDLEKSDLAEGIIFFKEIPEKDAYKDIAEHLFIGKNIYYISSEGVIDTWVTDVPEKCLFKDNSTSIEQLESILALNMLCNVAKYLNGDWLPKNGESHYFLMLNMKNNKLETLIDTTILCSSIYFKTDILAQQAIEILGEETTRKALILNH